MRPAGLRGIEADVSECPYLPGRRFHAFYTLAEWNANTYRSLMDLRFRRSGVMLYQPSCPTCDACRPIRVDVTTVQLRSDQRRCAQRNADLQVSWHPRGIDAERRDLYYRYQREIHGDDKEADDDCGAHLVEDGGVPGGELHARDANGTLLAVSICDTYTDALSSVYCYWEPNQARRGLGTFMALAEMQYCRLRGMQWWYLGFAVSGCAKMAYKERYTPHEILLNGQWERRG